MAKIVTLKNNNDEEVYPITTAEAVNGGLYADNGIEVTGVIPDVTSSRIVDGAVTPAKIALGGLFVAAPALSSQKSVAANTDTDSQTITLGSGTWMVSWMIRGYGDSSATQYITGKLVEGSTERQSVVINAPSQNNTVRFQVIGGCIVTPTANTVYKTQLNTPIASYISTSSYLYAIRIG